MLDDLLREAAQRGELTHFSVCFLATKKAFVATFANAAEVGKYHYAEHKTDPVTASINALQEGRRRKLTGSNDATPAKPDAKRGGGKNYVREADEDFG
jgi:hypothetical protein